MATLAGNTIASTYPLLLKVDSNGLDGQLRAIQDGDATDSVLYLATDSALISGNGTKLYFFDADGGEYISADNGGDLTIAAGTALNITADVIDLSDATKDVTLNGAVDALNFDSNTLSIDASNNRVGIGTASPSDNVHIVSTSSETGMIIQSNTGGTGSAIGGRIKLALGARNNSGSGQADTQSGDTLGQIMFEGQGTDYSYQGGNIKTIVTTGDGDDNRSNQGTAMTFETLAVGSASPAERMRIASDGKLFINQDNNSISIDIDSEATTESVILVDSPASTTHPIVNLTNLDSLTTGGGQRIASNSSDNNTRYLLFIENDHTSATGTRCLNIKQDAAQTAMFVDQGADGHGIDIDTEATVKSAIRIIDPKHTTGTVLEISDVDAVTSGSAALFYSNSSSNTSRELVEIHNNNANADNAVCLFIQQNGADASIELAGNGSIKFPGTQGASSDANSLDDYEEGEYTIAITGTTSGSWTMDSSYNTMQYTKIGRMVTVTGKYQTSSGSGAGILRFSLPFTVLDSTDQSGTAAGTITINRGAGSAAIPTAATAVAFEGGAFMNVQLANESGGIETYVEAANLDGTIEGNIGITYFTAS